ncbi:MAG: sigma-70 family RNA polymerase sigma factor [Clostridiaceae bacterium]|nr:sigma-70 family RNA polymerase sigma factor [Clostridiaceae bacterium]
MKITEKNFVRNLEDRNEKALEYVIENYGALVKAIDYQRKYNNLLSENSIDNLNLGSHSSVEDTLLQSDRKELADEILNGLSNDERTIFQEFYINEKKATEIGQNLGIRQSAVYNKLSRTRKRLRHKYGNRILEVIENE